MQFKVIKAGKRFYFPGQDEVLQEKKAWVELRPMSHEKIRELIRQSSHQEVGFRAVEGEKQPRQISWTTFDDNKLYEMTWDWVIINWGNIEVDNVTIPCTFMNKLAVMGNDEFFASNVIAWRDSIEESLVDLVEVIRKNLSSTSIDSIASLPAALVENSLN